MNHFTGMQAAESSAAFTFSTTKIKKYLEVNEMSIVNLIEQSGIAVALLGLLASAIAYGKTYLDARTKEATAKIQDTNIKNAVDAVENCATTVVYELAQTTVDDLKAKSADGKLTADEIAQLKADSLAKVKQLIGTDVYGTIHTVFGNAEAWITSTIEAAVKSLKLNSPVTLVGEAITAPSVPAAPAAPAPTATDATSEQTV
jgi:hypothetical protein